ncbi:MAG: T9SS type A sorting domain-containing protein [Bacteroidetes bacterium]|nr:T9SS type A sorting domain-containing protein [Bacteroidota bacterium]MCB0841852.1 T9SS type A sorting domain-containing protein [Bacteroidota bacterium]
MDKVAMKNLSLLITPNFFNSNLQISTKVIFLFWFFGLIYTNINAQVLIQPEPLNNGDIVSIQFDYETPSAPVPAETEVFLSYELSGFSVSNPDGLELVFNENSICPDCYGNVWVDNSNERVNIGIFSPNEEPITGSGNLVSVEGIVIEMDDINSRKAVSEEISFELYPNPASHFIFIKGGENLEKARILSLDGKVVKEVSILSDSMKIPVNDLTPGNYIVQTFTNQGQSTHKRLSII